MTWTFLGKDTIDFKLILVNNSRGGGGGGGGRICELFYLVLGVFLLYVHSTYRHHSVLVDACSCNSSEGKGVSRLDTFPLSILLSGRM